jgi:phage-related baseplate assembly protein
MLHVPEEIEGLSVTGPTDTCEFHEKNTDCRKQDVSAMSQSPATMLITVLRREGDGTAAANLLATVSIALNLESLRPVA